MLATEYREKSEIEKQRELKQAKTIFPPTGEIVGTTEWRRWWTEDGWHAKTPQAILEEYGWLMDSSLEMPEGFGERQDERERARRRSA